jgi:hypothetical protein
MKVLAHKVNVSEISNLPQSDKIPEAAPALGFQTVFCELAQHIVKAQSDWDVAARA